MNNTTPKSEVHNCDCVEFMRTLPDKCFSLAIADPPYGGAGDEQMDGGGQIRTTVRPLQTTSTPPIQKGKHIKLDSTNPKDRMYKYRKNTPPNSTTQQEEGSSDTKEPG